jgi:hypothetical protein
MSVSGEYEYPISKKYGPFKWTTKIKWRFSGKEFKDFVQISVIMGPAP